MNSFINLLFNIPDIKNYEIDKDLRDTFFKSFPETPDNHDSFNNISYGCVENFDSYLPKNIYGLKLKNKDVLLSEMIYTIENMISNEIPKELIEKYPNVNKEEWEACLRITMLILSSFEIRHKK